LPKKGGFHLGETFFGGQLWVLRKPINRKEREPSIRGPQKERSELKARPGGFRKEKERGKRFAGGGEAPQIPSLGPPTESLKRKKGGKRREKQACGASAIGPSNPGDNHQGLRSTGVKKRPQQKGR